MARKQNSPTIVLFFMGLIFTVIGSLIVIYVAKDTTLTCQRAADRCYIEEKSTFGEIETVESFNLESLSGAEIENSRNSDGKTMYKVMLVVDNMRIPLSGCSTSDYKSQRKNVRLINNYVNSMQENFYLLESAKIFRIMGFVFAGVGLLLLLSTLGGLFKLIAFLFVMLSKR